MKSRHTLRLSVALGGALTAFVTLVAVSCGSETDVATGRALSEACSLTSDCAKGLICAIGRCRVRCVTSADCSGGTCITDDDTGSCQLPDEKNTPCTRPGDCPSPLACATDYRCRNLCQTDDDCNMFGVSGRVCAVDGQGVQYCADPPEVDLASGALTATPPPGAPDASVVESIPRRSTGGSIAYTFGPTGGTLGIGAVKMTIPPGALDHNVRITITPRTAPVTGSIGQAYEIGPTGTTFLKPVSIVFAYAPAELNGKPPSSFSVSTIVDQAWKAVSPPIIDAFALTIGGTTSHLSPYALAANDIVDLDSGPSAADGEGGPSTSTDSGPLVEGGPETGPDDGGPLPEGGPLPDVPGDVAPDALVCVPVPTVQVAVKLAIPVGWPSSTAFQIGSGTAYVWLGAMMFNGPSLQGSFEVCGLTLPDVAFAGRGTPTKLQLPFTDATWTTAPRTFSFTGSQAGTSPPASYVWNNATSLFGVAAGSAEATAAWPADCQTNCTPNGSFPAGDGTDEDKDGHPGITANPPSGVVNGVTYDYPPTSDVVGAQVADQVYLALRLTFALNGNRKTDCSQISGSATVSAFETHVLGCHATGGTDDAAVPGICTTDQVAFLDQHRPVFDPQTSKLPSTFEARVLPGGASAPPACSAVRAALP